MPAMRSVWAAVSTRSGTDACRPSSSRSRSLPTRSTAASRSSAVRRAATAREAMPATFWVPLRRPRSWPPPSDRGERSTPSRTTSTPTPLGPPNLWPLIVTRSATEARSATSSQQNACTASVCSTAAGARSRTTSATAASGWTVPISLLAAMTDTRVTESSRASASRSRSITPSAPTGTTRPLRDSTGSSTAWCSMAVHTTVPPRRSCTPSTARLSASVPPLVKTTSPGSAPASSATTSRASSIARRASRAAAWAPDGLAKRSVRKASSASTAAGRMGVVAA